LIISYKLSTIGFLLWRAFVEVFASEIVRTSSEGRNARDAFRWFLF
jgi:hypothetical protein